MSLHAARVAVACLDFVAEELEAERITPEVAARAIRVCAQYCKSHLPEATVYAWPAMMHEFRTVIWAEILKEAGVPLKETIQ